MTLKALEQISIVYMHPFIYCVLAMLIRKVCNCIAMTETFASASVPAESCLPLTSLRSCASTSSHPPILALPWCFTSSCCCREARSCWASRRLKMSSQVLSTQIAHVSLCLSTSMLCDCYPLISDPCSGHYTGQPQR